jgi:hypothetical protein
MFAVRPQNEAHEGSGAGGMRPDVHAHDGLRLLRPGQEHRHIGTVGVRHRLEQGQGGAAAVFLNSVEVSIVNAPTVRMIDPLRRVAEGQSRLFAGLP